MLGTGETDMKLPHANSHMLSSRLEQCCHAVDSSYPVAAWHDAIGQHHGMLPRSKSCTRVLSHLQLHVHTICVPVLHGDLQVAEQVLY